MKPLVSVIVPTYHRTSHLKAALISLCQQDYPFIEIIVVDDNGDPMYNQQTKQVAAEIQTLLPEQYSFILITNPKNTGAAKSRNIGIYASHGTYITFLDDDDLYLPSKINAQVAVMQNSSADYSLMDLDLYDAKGHLARQQKHPYLKNAVTQKELMRFHLLYHLTGTDTMMFRKEYLLKIGCFGTIDVGDEFYLMMKAIENGGRFVYHPQSLVHALIHYDGSGLSGGAQKLSGEENLFTFKKTYFQLLNKKDIRYILMRHHAVLAFAYLKRKSWIRFLLEASCAVGSSPFDCFHMLCHTLPSFHSQKT